MKNAHILMTILCLLGCSAVPVSASKTEQLDHQQPRITQQQQSALQEVIRMYRETLDTLPKVCDKASADAAAAAITAHQARIGELSTTLSSIDADMIQEAMDKASISRIHSEAEINRLLFADFYGSAALSDELMSLPVYALPTQNLPEPILCKLADMAQNALRHSAELSKVTTGGPGQTRKTAWVLSQAPDIGQVDFCSLFVRCIYPDTTPFDEAKLEPAAFYSQKIFADNKAYIHFCLDVFPIGEPGRARYRFHQWFDISAIVPFRSEADVRQAAEQLLSTLQQLSALVDGVHDKASADAAAEKIPALRQLGQQQVIGLRWLTEVEFSRIVRENNLDLNTLMSGFGKLEEADFHGSEKLRDALRLSK